MLQVVLGAAFTAVPVMLLIPPVRKLSSFILKMEDLLQDAAVQTTHMLSVIGRACSALRSSLLVFLGRRPTQSPVAA